MKITNREGRSFLVRVVRKGDRYGYDDALVHDRDDALIEFYDLKYKDKSGFGPRGQFVTRYYAETLASHPRNTGLDLHGGTPAWSLDAEAFAPVRELARELRRERFEAAIRGPKRDPRAMKTKRRKKTKSAKFERCVRSVKKSRSAANPWAVCHAAMKRGKRDPGGQRTTLRCDMERGCERPVTHVDEKGYVYCTPHGERRRMGGIRCRRLRPEEIKKLEGGQPISYGRRDPPRRRAATKHGRRDPGKLRVERGPTGAAVWHLPNSKLIILWNGPGARLRMGTNQPGTSLMSIDHPSADGSYSTFKQANDAVKAFLRAGPASSRSSSRDPRRMSMHRPLVNRPRRDPGRGASSKEMKTISHRRIDDTARRMMRKGLRLTWHQADSIGDDGHQWLKDRLGLVSKTDEEGITYTPRSERDPRGALVNRPRHARRSIPSQHEYESRELSSFHQDLQRVEKASLADRKEGAREFARAMEHDPEIVAQRVSWLLDGNYGFGSYKQANEVAKNTRMNRVAWLSQVAGALEWHSPFRMTAAAWKKMPKAAKDKLHHAVSRVLEAHLREGGGQ